MKRAIPILFILAGCALLCGGLAMFGAALVWKPPPDVPDAFEWKPLLDQVETRGLAPETVVLPLTGIDSADALSAMLDRGHIENAFALIAYDDALTSPNRIGGLLQIANRYASSKQTRKAAVCYQAAALIATLAPALADPARLDTYLQAGAGLRGIGAQDAARMVTDQAYLVAQYSPALRRETRARRLNQVADEYDALGVSSLARQARVKAGEAATEPSETATTAARLPYSPLFGSLPARPEVDRAMQRRVAAAKLLADDLAQHPPKSAAEMPKDSVAQLTDALLEEDGARLAYYDLQFARVKDSKVLLTLWLDRVTWLGVKYRIARGVFSAALVPDWSKDAQTIASDWNDAWNELYRLEHASAAALTNPQESREAFEDILRRELIAARFGWTSGANEKVLSDSLRDLMQSLREANHPELRLDTLTRSGKTIYWLVPNDLYGLNDKALPR